MNSPTYVFKRPGNLWLMLDVALQPKRFGSCFDAIVIDAAVVNPDVTGTDTKSTKNPRIFKAR